MIIGIDPGSEKSALVVIDHSRKILENLYDTNAEIRCRLRLLGLRNPTGVAIEDIRAYGMGVRPQALETKEQVGRFVEAAASTMGDEKVFKASRPTVLAHLIGVAHGKKNEVKVRLEEIYGPAVIRLAEPRTWKDPETGRWRKRKTLDGPTAAIKKHEWDALAMCEWLISGGKL